ncbi:hypothetical protein STEG23_016065, partial [Scotinomys teguina]
MEVVAAAPRCQLLLIVLATAMLLLGMKVLPLLVRRKITRTIQFQESINKVGTEGSLYPSTPAKKDAKEVEHQRDTAVDIWEDWPGPRDWRKYDSQTNMNAYRRTQRVNSRPQSPRLPLSIFLFVLPCGFHTLSSLGFSEDDEERKFGKVDGVGGIIGGEDEDDDNDNGYEDDDESEGESGDDGDNGDGYGDNDGEGEIGVMVVAKAVLVVTEYRNNRKCPVPHSCGLGTNMEAEAALNHAGNSESQAAAPGLLHMGQSHMNRVQSGTCFTRLFLKEDMSHHPECPKSGGSQGKVIQHPGQKSVIQHEIPAAHFSVR